MSERVGPAMPSDLTERKEVAVVFRKEDSILIPPFEIARAMASSDETYESAYYRLCREHGVMDYVDQWMPAPSGVEEVQRIYVTRARNRELDRSPFFVPIESVEAHLGIEDGLELRSPVDRAIILAVRNLLAPPAITLPQSFADARHRPAKSAELILSHSPSLVAMNLAQDSSPIDTHQHEG